MANELDEQLKAVKDRLTASRSFFERDFTLHGGHLLPVFRNAPPTLPALFDRACHDFHDRVFLIDGDLRLTYEEVHALARRAAAGLIAGYGVKPGDRIGIVARNSANWIIAYMAILMAGGCATLLNAWWKGDELADAIALAECSIVLADRDRATRLDNRQVATRLILFEHGQPEIGLATILASEGKHVSLPVGETDNLATILFTSGSTGRSKAAFSDQRAITQAATSFAAQSILLTNQLREVGVEPVENQSILLCVPLFHVTGEIAVLLQSFFAGASIVVMGKWDARSAMQLIERERVTLFVGVPMMSQQIANHPDRTEYDLSSCKGFAVGGAPQHPGHVRQIRDLLPHSFPLIGYGLTETNCVGCTNSSESYLAKPNSTGPATAPLVELAIFGPDGNRLPTGEHGEVGIRSVCNFSGYWNDATATAAAIRPDGFFLTGDLGYLDEDGFLFIVDRIKDIIIRGGENISCVEVEQALYSHPAVSEVSVFGLEDELHGEVPVAVFRAKPGHSLTESDLRKYLAGRLATFKQPVRYWSNPAPFPLLGAHKIDKVSLKARYSRQWESARSAA